MVSWQDGLSLPHTDLIRSFLLVFTHYLVHNRSIVCGRHPLKLAYSIEVNQEAAGYDHE